MTPKQPSSPSPALMTATGVAAAGLVAGVAYLDVTNLGANAATTPATSTSSQSTPATVSPSDSSSASSATPQGTNTTTASQAGTSSSVSRGTGTTSHAKSSGS